MRRGLVGWRRRGEGGVRDRGRGGWLAGEGGGMEAEGGRGRGERRQAGARRVGWASPLMRQRSLWPLRWGL